MKDKGITDKGITDCPFTTCALNSGKGGCVSTNTKQCESIPDQFDEDKRNGNRWSDYFQRDMG